MKKPWQELQNTPGIPDEQTAIAYWSAQLALTQMMRGEKDPERIMQSVREAVQAARDPVIVAQPMPARDISMSEAALQAVVDLAQLNFECKFWEFHPGGIGRVVIAQAQEAYAKLKPLIEPYKEIACVAELIRTQEQYAEKRAVQLAIEGARAKVRA